MNVDYSTRDSVTIRQPSTALLCVDSADRDETNYPNPYSFQIYRRQTLIPGAFTRVGVTEVCFGYSLPNIHIGKQNIEVDISGDAGSPRTITIPDGSYTAYQVLQNFVEQLNDLSGSTGSFFYLGTRAVPGIQPLNNFTNNVEWSIYCEEIATGGPNEWEIVQAGTDLDLYTGLDIFNLGFLPNQAGGLPDLRETRYADIVCTELTQSQGVKDTSTISNSRNLLCRFYFASDTPQYDAGGLIQYIGYLPFYILRQFSLPKQIKFDPIISIGSLLIQVFDDQGNLLESDDPSFIDKTNWNMTLQLSEN